MGIRITRAARRPGSLITLAGALAAFTRVAVAQVAVDQLELHVPLRAGATMATAQFTAANPSSAAAHATISMQDWDRSESGENRYYPTGTLPTSCGSHVSVYPSVLQLEPRSAQTIRVMVDSTSTIAHGCYTILFVETPPPPRSTPQSGVQYSVRYGVKLYVEPETSPTAEVTDVDVVDRPDSTRGAKRGATIRELQITYKNTGARQTVAHGAVEIRRPDNSVVTKVDIPEFPTLPGATRRLGVALPHLPAGRYVLLALLDYEGAEIAAGQVELEVP